MAVELPGLYLLWGDGDRSSRDDSLICRPIGRCEGDLCLITGGDSVRTGNCGKEHMVQLQQVWLGERTWVGPTSQTPEGRR